MKEVFFSAVLLAMIAGCGRNEPGTMGGETGTPKTESTGAPAQAAKDSAVSNPKQSARESEHAMSRFGESTDTNATAATLPQASTLSTNSAGTTR